MIDFKTRKTRTVLVLSIIYIVLLPIILALMLSPNDFGLIHLLVVALQYPRDFIIFYTQGALHPSTEDVFAYIYFAPLFFYWIFFPVLRFIKRWVSRGQ